MNVSPLNCSTDLLIPVSTLLIRLICIPDGFKITEVENLKQLSGIG